MGVEFEVFVKRTVFHSRLQGRLARKLQQCMTTKTPLTAGERVSWRSGSLWPTSGCFVAPCVSHVEGLQDRWLATPTLRSSLLNLPDRSNLLYLIIILLFFPIRRTDEQLNGLDPKLAFPSNIKIRLFCCQMLFMVKLYKWSEFMTRLHAAH